MPALRTDHRGFASELSLRSTSWRARAQLNMTAVTYMPAFDRRRARRGGYALPLHSAVSLRVHVIPRLALPAQCPENRGIQERHADAGQLSSEDASGGIDATSAAIPPRNHTRTPSLPPSHVRDLGPQHMLGSGESMQQQAELAECGCSLVLRHTHRFRPHRSHCCAFVA